MSLDILSLLMCLLSTYLDLVPPVTDGTLDEVSPN